MSIPDDDYIGEPGYPAPWTTANPREGLRDTDAAIIVSLAPDVCKSPGKEIPYPVVDFCGHDEGYTPSVRFTGQRAMVFRSHTTDVHGDEPGVGGGVVSETCGGICEPIEHADQVFAEGSPVIRHLDQFHMNNRNTVGEAIFVRDTAIYAAPVDDDPLPGSMQYAELSGETMTDGSFFAQPEVELPPVEVPVPEAPPPPDPSPPPPPESRLRRAIRRLGEFGRSVKINPVQWWLQHTIEKYPEDRRRIRADELARASQNESLSDEAQEILRETARRMRDAATPDAAQEIEEEGWERLRELEADGRLNRPEADTATDEDTEPRPIPAPEETGTRVDERTRYRNKCEVGPYSEMRRKCNQYGMQAHHIVPDYTLRYGTRVEGQRGLNRIPNMPSLNDGMTICVIGFASEEETEHNRAHFADAAIADLSLDDPPHTARLAEVVNASEIAMVAVRPDCAAQIEAALETQFGPLDQDQLLRTKKRPPLPAETIEALSSGARTPRP